MYLHAYIYIYMYIHAYIYTYINNLEVKPTIEKIVP